MKNIINGIEINKNKIRIYNKDNKIILILFWVIISLTIEKSLTNY